MNSAGFYLEIGENSLLGLHGEQGIELPMERLPNGRLTHGCRQNLKQSLANFFCKKVWLKQSKVFCAIPARGVSLRRISLPAANKENLRRLLLLQIESLFPLPPDELAWGYVQLGDAKRPKNGSPGQPEFLVAAVKK